MTHKEECLHFEDLMADWAAGVLAPEDETTLRAHLQSGCEECAGAMAEFRLAGIALASAAAEDPTEGFREKLMSRVRGNGRPPEPKAVPSNPFIQLAAGITVAYPSLLPWKPTPIDGVKQKVLFVDKESGTYTALVQIAGGTIYPAHRHAGTEHIFMLAGTLTVGKITVQKGDYCVAHGGSCHDEIRAIDDSEFLVVANLHDEMISAAHV